jgi:RNA polymerase sigma-70 factor (ECF subfamily)
MSSPGNAEARSSVTAPPSQLAQEVALDFTRLYEEHFAFVWRSLRRLGVATDQLDDAVQDVFLVVHRRLAEFEGRSSHRTWLFGIAVRTAGTLRRRNARKPTEPLGEDVPDQRAEGVTEATHAARLVQRLLDELDDERRAVFVLAELEQMTAPEISEALSVNLNTVYSRLRLARRDFEAALKRHQSRSSR